MTPERSPDRDTALRAVLPHIASHGWRWEALMAAGYGRLDAELLFPGGTADLLDAWCDLADRDMDAAAIAQGVADQRLSRRVRTLIALRLANAAPHKDAMRRAMGVFVLPSYAPLAARITARTVDAIWHAAGDTSADFSWYTKRAILAGVWTSTLLFWLVHDDDATLAFLDRRLTGVAQIGKLRGRVEGALARLRPAA